jgi:hypothetical protein
MIPDIAMNADPAVGGALNSAGPHPPQFLTEADLGSPGDATYCGTPNCSFLSLLGLPLPIGAPPPGGAGGWYPIGGTSLATPTAAAAAVLWDEQAEHRGLSGGLGFLNPQLYSLAADRTAYARDFHDITTGTNSDQYDATDCPAGCNPQHLYAAVPGYDMATGLGSFDAARLGDDLVAQADRVALTPDSVRLYGYLRGPATTTPVSVTGAPAGESFRASSSARWLRVRRSGRLPGTLSLHADPAGLKQGARSARITVTAADGSRATLSVSYSVGPRARIAVSPGRLRFTERAIDAHGRTIGATCNATTWNDELIDSADFAAGAYVGQPVDPSTKATLKIGNRGPRGSTLHWQADLVAPTGGWLSQDLNPNGNPSGFQTTPQPPLVPTGGTVRGHAAASTLKLASLGDGNALGGYPPMNQGTYAGEVVIRDLADPRVHVIVPAALVLGNGGGTPRIVATPHAISLRLAPGASTTVDLSLSDAGRACGYVYSLQSTAPWTSFAADLQSGTVGASPAGAPPAGASDTGAGNGLTPVTVSAAGLSAGRHTGEIVVASENATGSPYRVPITLTVSR